MLQGSPLGLSIVVGDRSGIVMPESVLPRVDCFYTVQYSTYDIYVLLFLSLCRTFFEWDVCGVAAVACCQVEIGLIVALDLFGVFRLSSHKLSRKSSRGCSSLMSLSVATSSSQIME